MAEALLWAGMLLTHRPERRKIVIPMTDGQPDNTEKTRRAVVRLRSCDIEVYGIGILDSSITSWLPESCAIKRIEELPAALIGLLKEALITKRRAA
jgi:nitric oxide reductase activation protein